MLERLLMTPLDQCLQRRVRFRQLPDVLAVLFERHLDFVEPPLDRRHPGLKRVEPVLDGIHPLLETLDALLERVETCANFVAEREKRLDQQVDLLLEPVDLLFESVETRAQFTYLHLQDVDITLKVTDLHRQDVNLPLKVAHVPCHLLQLLVAHAFPRADDDDSIVAPHGEKAIDVPRWLKKDGRMKSGASARADARAFDNPQCVD
jgi:hypothetical protein